MDALQRIHFNPDSAILGSPSLQKLMCCLKIELPTIRPKRQASGKCAQGVAIPEGEGCCAALIRKKGDWKGSG